MPTFELSNHLLRFSFYFPLSSPLSEYTGFHKTQKPKNEQNKTTQGRASFTVREGLHLSI